jgi:hypothetical protein
MVCTRLIRVRDQRQGERILKLVRKRCGVSRAVNAPTESECLLFDVSPQTLDIVGTAARLARRDADRHWPREGGMTAFEKPKRAATEPARPTTW